MAATLYVPSIGRHGRQVGVVLVDATITNEGDVVLHERGQLSPASIRSIDIQDMLVDTGATTLALPIDIIRELGLRHFRDVRVRTAAGESTVGLYKDATLTIEGRSGTFECLALAEGSTALLGSIPMEMMGIEPDLSTRSVRLLPDQGSETYLLLY